MAMAEDVQHREQAAREGRLSFDGPSRCAKQANNLDKFRGEPYRLPANLIMDLHIQIGSHTLKVLPCLSWL